MEALKIEFTQNHFTLTKETAKSIEFEHENGQIVYLLHNKEITIVLNPKVVEGNQYLLDRSFKTNHNTSFQHFPKKQNKGKELIHYGYSFKFQSPEELAQFLKIDWKRWLMID
ncbi:hypothetical protein [Pseudalkalibacillus hwajinpoensis]|uniref:hypothetical protein n=1 Tax=Guptibacillus hwajinpoensis TaxID=208199 RepID=UPI001CFF0851|nr:hypothetical protein [Pseudalkalibacillus hwajinpoensis]